MEKRIQTASFGVPEYEVTREGTYRPRILPEHLRRLWLLKQKTGKTIVKLIAEAIEYYLQDVERG